MVMTVRMSRSEQKRQIKQLENLVAELSTLPSSLIDQLPSTEEIRSLLHEAGQMQDGSRKRHIKYITKKLKDEPVEELYTFLSQKKGTDLQEKKIFHEAEYLRDSLLNEAIEHQRIASRDHIQLEEDWPSSIADEICSKYSDLDRRACRPSRQSPRCTRSLSRQSGMNLPRQPAQTKPA